MHEDIIESEEANEKKKDDVIEKSLQQLKELYEMLERLNAKGLVANAWGGCEDDFSDPDGSVLSDFMEYEGFKNEIVNASANELDIWINWHTKEVWDFSVDILLKHRDEWRWKV